MDTRKSHKAAVMEVMEAYGHSARLRVAYLLNMTKGCFHMRLGEAESHATVLDTFPTLEDIVRLLI
jgi:hypothetical protein